jgi:hypothetical protein
MANDLFKWQLLPTPNPSKFGFSVIVPQKVIVKNPSQFPVEGSLFNEFFWPPNPDMKNNTRFGLYIYVQCRQARTTEGDQAIEFIFGPNMTDEEKQEPFRETTHKRNHPWPPMLLALTLIPDYTFLRQGKGYSAADNEISDVVAPSYYVREVYVPGVNEGTKMIKREFYSPTKFDIPQTPVPVPTSVAYDINGVRGTFPECLHPQILIQSTRSGIAQVVAGVVSEVGGALEGQLFPETNFKEWAPYITTDTQEQVDTGWYRVQWMAIPPEKPKTIVQ